MTLGDLIEKYISFRQSLGERCHTNGRILRAFGRAVGVKTSATDIRPAKVDAFLAGAGPITSAWHIKHSALRGLYAYAISRDHLVSSPVTAVVPKRPPRFVPYIYSHDEIRQLLSAADIYPRNQSKVEPVTVHTLILLLYGAGLRLREALALSRGDADLEARVLTIRQTKFYKSRFVPVGQQLCDALMRYARRPRPRGPRAGETAPFFATRTGDAMNQYTTEGIFRRLRASAGIQRTDGARYQPRLHDLRHTFAVHRLTSWYRQGLDVPRLLPHLSVYLGHVHLDATAVYLSMTPELLDAARQRFERYATAPEVSHA